MNGMKENADMECVNYDNDEEVEQECVYSEEEDVNKDDDKVEDNDDNEGDNYCKAEKEGEPRNFFT